MYRNLHPSRFISIIFGVSTKHAVCLLFAVSLLLFVARSACQWVALFSFFVPFSFSRWVGLFILVGDLIVSLAAVFRDVTQRSPERNFRGSVASINLV